MQPFPSWAGNLRLVGIAFLVLIMLVVGYLVYHAGQFEGLTSKRALDYAQLARNLATGNGFTTQVMRPLFLAKIPRLHKHPELMAAPLHPYIASLFMRIMPDNERALALCCGLPFLLTGLLILVIGWSLFDAWVGGVAAAVYLTNDTLLQYSISGLEVSCLTFLSALLFLTCYAMVQRPQWQTPLAAGAGALMGLIYLTHHLWLVLVPVIAAYILLYSRRPRQWATIAVFLGATILVMTPSLLRKAHLVGNPFYGIYTTAGITGTRTDPGNTLYRQFTEHYPSWIWYCGHRPVEIAEKFRDGLRSHYLVLGTMMGWYVMPFFLAAILVTLRDNAFERVRYLWYAAFVVLLVASSFTITAPRLLIPLCPLPIVVASAFFVRLLKARLGDPHAPTYRRNMLLAIAALLILHSMPVAFQVLRAERDTTRERVTAEAASAASQLARITDGPIVTDVPWIIAWHADKPVIWLPKDTAGLTAMEDTIGRIRWMLLTPQVVSREYNLRERTLKEWGPMWRAGISGDRQVGNYTVYTRLMRNQWILFRLSATAE